ncbi:hypothetical protein ACOXXX_04775 [Thalassococcus sp. BH17M4-6]|uniref:hypothetical protein n=1 Tax=Thalassococcus sp. BH17M4-6 TaxID=3413148 RepID=UPI003BDB69B5
MTRGEDFGAGPRDDLPGGDAALCAEYVLGLLSDAERVAFEDRLATEPHLQAEVAYWAENLADLAGAIPEVPPSPAVLRRIELATFGPAPPSVWRQLRPYLLGALAAAGLAWVASLSGLLDTGAVPPDTSGQGAETQD